MVLFTKTVLLFLVLTTVLIYLVTVDCAHIRKTLPPGVIAFQGNFRTAKIKHIERDFIFQNRVVPNLFVLKEERLTNGKYFGQRTRYNVRWKSLAERLRLKRQAVGESNSTSESTTVSSDSLTSSQPRSASEDAGRNERSDSSINRAGVENSSVSTTRANSLSDIRAVAGDSSYTGGTVAGVVQSTTVASLTKTSSHEKSTVSQISTASGQGNKAGVTSSNTTQLSLTSPSSSHAFTNSSPQNIAASSRPDLSRPSEFTASLAVPAAKLTSTSTTATSHHAQRSTLGDTVTSARSETWTVKTSKIFSQKRTTTAFTSKVTSTLSPLNTSKNVKTTTAVSRPSGARQTRQGDVKQNGSVSSGTSTPVPEPESVIPSAESEPIPEGEGSPVIMAGNNSTLMPVPEPTGDPLAEPTPYWPEAKKIWKEAWPIHIYLLGTAFALLAVFSLISIIRLWRIKHLFSQKYFISLNLLMFIMGVIRAVYLLVDGYNSENTYPIVLNYFLFSTGFPCLTSAFSILFFALLQATRMQLVGPKVQKVQVLVAIIVCHFAISIITDIVVGYFYGAKIMLFLCELISILWGGFLVVGYCYIFRRLYAAALKRQRVMERLSTVRSSQTPGSKGGSYVVSDRKTSQTDSTTNVKSTQKYTLSLAVKVTLGTAVLGFVFIALEIYGMVGVFGVFSDSIPDPWPWWCYEFGLRLVELLMCVTMSYIGTQPFRYVEGLRTRRWCFYCAACLELVRPRCGSQAGNDNLAWHKINPDLSNSASSDPESALRASRSVFRKKSKSKSTAKKPVPYEAIQMQVKHNAHNGHAGNGANGHINPVLESGTDSRPVSMLVFEDGFIRFRNDDELVVAISAGGDSLAGDLADQTPSGCANDLVVGAQSLSQTNSNFTNCNVFDHSMTCGEGISNPEHVHGIVNDGFSCGADSTRNSGVIPDNEANTVLPLDRLQFAERESDAYSASSMHSYSRSNFSQSIEQELQKLVIKKPTSVKNKAKSATNLPAEIEDSNFTNSFIFTEKSPHVLTGVRSPPHERLSQKCFLTANSLPESPVKAPLSSPSDKKNLLSRSYSDHLPLVKHASIRTKVFKNAKYFSLSDLELQAKSDDLGQDLEQVHQPPQSNPVKLISSRRVPDSDLQREASKSEKDSIDLSNGSLPVTNGSLPATNGSPTKDKPAKKVTSKTKRHQRNKSKSGDSDQSEC